MIEIYTDGSCIHNPGPGGWAAIIIEDGNKTTLHGHDPNTTNNRMEMMAAIKGLEAISSSTDVTVYSDSKYLVHTMNHSWKRNVNKDLWAKLDIATDKHHITWKWIRGHTGHPLNEEADKLANQEARIQGEEDETKLSHIDQSGKAHMVDIGSKADTERVATAKGFVEMSPKTINLIQSNQLVKGDVLGISRVAGITAAKHTSLLIPLCHAISINHVSVEFELDIEHSIVVITTTVKTTAKTGVEMEAMTAASVAALTIYDMCKSVDRSMKLCVRLAQKSGGKSKNFVMEEND